MGAGEAILSYYESFVYSDLCKQKHIKKMFQERAIAVTIDQFIK